MNPRLFTGIATLGCVMMASCYPYEETPRRKPRKPDASISAPAQQNIQLERDRMKQQAEQEKLAATQAQPQGNAATTMESPKPAVEKRQEYPFSNPVPGKVGFVFSPYNNKVVDVRDIPSGTLVQDPTYPAAEKKYFRVP